ncbi:MAG: NAD(P)H-dependent glycerol-3-phosphate dehydrogenase [Pseudomonadota bacterium]
MSGKQLQTIGVVGGGAWGTALATVARRAGRDVLLWAHEPETVASINQDHTNPTYLPGIQLDPAIEATSQLGDVATCDAILIVSPAQHLRVLLGRLKPHVQGAKPLVLCCKGIEQQSGLLMSQVTADVLPDATIAVLSGPSFAAEVARQLPVAVTLATGKEDLGRDLSHTLRLPSFRCYWSDDVVGAEIGGAVKNVYAIAAGIVVGKELGKSAQAGLITRSFAEMARFGVTLGAALETLIGLSGLGDLVLTCGSEQSRNMSLGVALGHGAKTAEVLSERLSVTEGVATAQAMVQIARVRGIELPIAEAVHSIVSGETSVDTAIGALLSRPLRAETG